jgi:hypothetical protein
MINNKLSYLINSSPRITDGTTKINLVGKVKIDELPKRGNFIGKPRSKVRR